MHVNISTVRIKEREKEYIPLNEWDKVKWVENQKRKISLVYLNEGKEWGGVGERERRTKRNLNKYSYS